MKTLRLLFMTVLATLTVSATAQGGGAVAKADIYPESTVAYATAGGEFNIVIDMDNTIIPTVFTIYISVTDNFTIAKKGPKYKVTYTSRLDPEVYDTKVEYSENLKRYMLLGMASSEYYYDYEEYLIQPGSGKFVTVTMAVPAGTPLGVYNVNINKIMAVNYKDPDTGYTSPNADVKVYLREGNKFVAPNADSKALIFEIQPDGTSVQLLGAAGTLEGSLIVPPMISYDGTEYLVTTIADNAFKGNTSITNVVIPETITAVGASAFEGTGITNIYFPSSIKEMGAAVCKDCSRLEDARFGNGIIALPESALENCPALTTVMWGSGVTALGANALAGDANITHIVSAPAQPPVATGSGLDAVDEACKVTIPIGASGAYTKADLWNRFFSYEEVDDATLGADAVCDDDQVVVNGNTVVTAREATFEVYDLMGRRLLTRRGTSLTLPSTGSLLIVRVSAPGFTRVLKCAP